MILTTFFALIYDITEFIQASLSKNQGLFKDYKTILQFSRTKILEKNLDLSVKILLQDNGEISTRKVV